jgi:RimJ/RimL family protein N-acetyltransferase
LITIRPTNEADVETFYEHQADRVAAEMAVFPSRDRAAHHAHWSNRVLADPLTISRTVLVDGKVAGTIGSWLDDDGRRLVGYWIGRGFWGRGVATKGLALYLAEVRERPLYAYVAVTNVGSARVLEKNGFVGDPATETGHDGIAERLFVLSA